ncbi:hypothetical protein EI555_019785 [Monodon monoceros]|uniref:Uncharacterized protein n=1 Tax=Monodon monoceros TaxID=40151 RepID=A0A4U1FG30_MONMO|nr:hypothetical protein EI555_019785 [Monodon monoceros]
MNSSGNNENFEGSNSRPFFYVHPMAQQPLLGPWYRNPAYNPICVPGAGFTKMKMKDTETETEPQQAENLNDKRDVHSESNSRDLGRVTSIPANTFSPENVGEKKEFNKVDEGIQYDMRNGAE